MRRTATLAAWALLISTVAGTADTVVLKSGREINCTVLQYEDGKVKLATEAGNIRTGSISAVRKIEFEAGGDRSRKRPEQDADGAEEGKEDTGIKFGNSSLEGENLKAYKAAYQAVKEQVAEWNGLSDYERRRKAGLEDKDSIHFDSPHAEPDHDHMNKTYTGDWMFYFDCWTFGPYEVKPVEFEQRWWVAKVSKVGDRFQVLNVDLKKSRPF